VRAGPADVAAAAGAFASRAVSAVPMRFAISAGLAGVNVAPGVRFSPSIGHQLPP
jgi:hypothetical protein